jgi:hypothetical protein
MVTPCGRAVSLTALSTPETPRQAAPVFRKPSPAVRRLSFAAESTMVWNGTSPAAPAPEKHKEVEANE